MIKIDPKLFREFNKKVSELGGNVIRKKTAELLAKFTNGAKSYGEFYYDEALGIQIPESRKETLLKLERDFEGIASKIMNYFIETQIELIEMSVYTTTL